MAVPIDATPGGPNANSYVTLAEAHAYFATRRNSDAWNDALSDDDRALALIAGTRAADRETWRGVRVSADQALAWPRRLSRNESCEDRPEVLRDLDGTRIPQSVKDLVFEVALLELQGGTEDFGAPTGLEQFKSVSVGPISLTLREEAPPSDSLPSPILRRCWPLLASSEPTRVVLG